MADAEAAPEEEPSYLVEVPPSAKPSEAGPPDAIAEESGGEEAEGRGAGEAEMQGAEDAVDGEVSEAAAQPEGGVGEEHEVLEPSAPAPEGPVSAVEDPVSAVEEEPMPVDEEPEHAPEDPAQAVEEPGAALEAHQGDDTPLLADPPAAQEAAEEALSPVAHNEEEQGGGAKELRGRLGTGHGVALFLPFWVGACLRLWRGFCCQCARSLCPLVELHRWDLMFSPPLLHWPQSLLPGPTHLRMPPLSQQMPARSRGSQRKTFSSMRVSSS